MVRLLRKKSQPNVIQVHEGCTVLESESQRNLVRALEGYSRGDEWQLGSPANRQAALNRHNLRGQVSRPAWYSVKAEQGVMK
jgi:hypothetical protein